MSFCRQAMTDDFLTEAGEDPEGRYISISCYREDKIAMRKKTVISVLLAASLALSLAACGSAPQTAQPPAGEETATTAAGAAAQDDSAEAKSVQDEASEAVTAADAANTMEAVVAAESEDAGEKVKDEALENAIAAATAAEASEEEAAGTAMAETNLENGGLVIPVPEEYMDLLVITTPEKDENGMLFRFNEKLSVETQKAIAKAEGKGEYDGYEEAGWLFDIRKLTPDQVKELLCGYKTGRELFARDSEGNGYVFCHPTDVRVVREDYSVLQDPEDPWGILNGWKAAIPDRIVSMNPDLTAESHSDTDFDIYLAQIAYAGKTDYTLTKLDYAMNPPMEPRDDFDPTPYLDRLINGVTFEYSRDQESPSGEYVVLNFPNDKVRFDFCFGEKNLVRQVRDPGEEDERETIYEATFTDGESTVNDIMNEWCDALAQAYGYAGPEAEAAAAEAVSAAEAAEEAAAAAGEEAAH